MFISNYRSNTPSPLPKPRPQTRFGASPEEDFSKFLQEEFDNNSFNLLPHPTNTPPHSSTGFYPPSAFNNVLPQSMHGDGFHSIQQSSEPPNSVVAPHQTLVNPPLADRSQSAFSTHPPDQFTSPFSFNSSEFPQLGPEDSASGLGGLRSGLSEFGLNSQLGSQANPIDLSKKGRHIGTVKGALPKMEPDVKVAAERELAKLENPLGRSSSPLRGERLAKIIEDAKKNISPFFVEEFTPDYNAAAKYFRTKGASHPWQDAPSPASSRATSVAVEDKALEKPEADLTNKNQRKRHYDTAIPSGRNLNLQSELFISKNELPLDEANFINSLVNDSKDSKIRIKDLEHRISSFKGNLTEEQAQDLFDNFKIAIGQENVPSKRQKKHNAYNSSDYQAQLAAYQQGHIGTDKLSSSQSFTQKHDDDKSDNYQAQLEAYEQGRPWTDKPIKGRLIHRPDSPINNYKWRREGEYVQIIGTYGEADANGRYRLLYADKDGKQTSFDRCNAGPRPRKNKKV